MHAELIVQRFFDQHLAAAHDARRRVLGLLVWAAMLGSALSLSRLARSLSGHERSMKACLKRVDRYVGHSRTGLEGEQVARALLARLCRWLSPLVIAVDWSAASPGGTFVELRASGGLPQSFHLGREPGIELSERGEPLTRRGLEDAPPLVVHVLLDDALLPARGHVAEVRIDEA